MDEQILKLNLEKGYTGNGVPFERIRRVTGYLAGDVRRFNNAKRQEERDRVKHTWKGGDIMSTQYICTDCGYIFEEPKRYSEDCTPYGGPSEPGFQRVYYGCPQCGGNYEEMKGDDEDDTFL